MTGPRPGMIFESEHDLLDSYKAYAKAKGFGVATRSRRGDKYLQYTCERGQQSESKKYSKRMDCPARINAINKGDGIWMIGKVFNEHNHELEPEMSEFMPAHRHLSNELKRQLEAHDRARMRLSKSIRMMEIFAGGPSNLGATVKDCRNYVEERRRLRLGAGDAVSIQKLFKSCQKNDKDFFYLMDVDDDSRLRNVLWIHPRSRAAYEDFHDVVSFDTTYLVNQYKMPFGSIVGVNHHNHSILLGCCLLTDETTDSFKWFFRNWLEAMKGVKPIAILTDQDESIRIALKEIMPESIHRFCIWHIVKKTSEKFKGVSDITAAKFDFNAMLYDSVSISEFESRWEAFKIKHGL
ncbi:protein FAR-RED IMPAIRED RESPONSE 1-like [Salvia miltiorrhiza]|uniref:protein FAR-RED IMPAIRED RESPONSE 1-like n=1 Tax=Salvia miltiorrhiza TaxID=226208 RepID=UPI0025AC3706|nr:protein FAR-RED IMPAIRED RESPONSE 1-like [Salvia miltiorrhiza]